MSNTCHHLRSVLWAMVLVGLVIPAYAEDPVSEVIDYASLTWVRSTSSVSQYYPAIDPIIQLLTPRLTDGNRTILSFSVGGSEGKWARITKAELIFQGWNPDTPPNNPPLQQILLTDIHSDINDVGDMNPRIEWFRDAAGGVIGEKVFPWQKRAATSWNVRSEYFHTITINSRGIDLINKSLPFATFNLGMTTLEGQTFRLGDEWQDPEILNKTWTSQNIKLRVTGYYKKPGKLPTIVPSRPCPVAGPQTVMGLSRVITTTLSHVHDAVDYTTAGAVDGCADCGAAAAPTSQLPALHVERFHRYRELDWRSSFGPGVFSGYDLSLAISLSERWAEFFDPHEDEPFLLNDQVGIGQYYDPAKRISYLSLLDATGNLTADPANIRSAKLLTQEGITHFFEVFRTEAGSSTNFHGRVKKTVDRNGNEVVFAYQFPDPLATDAALGYDRTQLWRLASITDSFGEVATIESARANGAWAITKITLPNSTSITYSYSGDHLVGVNKISFPDGTSSTFSTQFESAAQSQAVSIDDAAAEGIHRRKTLLLSTTQFINATGVRENQRPNLITEVRNGEQEVTFLAWSEEAGGITSFFLYGGGGLNGGGVLQRYDTNNGRPLGSAYATSWNLAQPTSAYVFDAGETYVSDGYGRLTGISDEAGRLTSFVRDPDTSMVTQTTIFSDSGDVQFGRTTSAHNNFRQPLSSTDTLNRVTSHQYDTKGNLLSSSEAAGSGDQSDTSWTYNGRGQVLTATDARGNVTLYTYAETAGNTYRRLISISQPPDVVGGTRPTTLFQYDAAGRLSSTTDPNGRVATYGYDGRNRLVSASYQDGTTQTVTYGSSVARTANLVTQRKDRNGNLTSFLYDLAGRRVEETIAGPASGPTPGPVVSTQTWTYLDGKDLLKTSSDNDDLVTYEYDYRLRRIAAVRSPSSTATLRDETAYSSDHRVLYTTDMHRRRTFFLYDRQENPTRVVRELILNGLTPPTGTAAIRAYVTALPRALGANPAYVIEDHTYDTEGQRTATVDARGFRSAFAYDVQGRLTSLVAGDASLQTGVAVRLMDAARTEYQYDDADNRVAEILPRSFTRNADGTFSLIAIPFRTSAVYNGRNLAQSSTVADGTPDQATTNYTYTLTGKRASESDPRNAAWLTRFTYSPCCDRLTRIDDPAGVLRSSYGYDGNGNVTVLGDGNGNLTMLTYDALGRVLTRTNPQGETTTWEYGQSATSFAVSGRLAFSPTSNGSYVSITNPVGEKVTTVRDGLGRVVREIDGNGYSSFTSYDFFTSGLVQTTRTDALGLTMRSAHDGNGGLREFYDEQNRLTLTTFDARGNQISQRDPNGVGFNVVNDLGAQPGYDAHNRLLKRTDTHLDSVSQTYDRHGNVLTSTDSLNMATSYTYDYRDRKVSMTDRVAGVTGYVYDKANRLTQITDADSAANGKTIYVFNARGNLESETFPAGKDGKKTVRTYAYDNADRLASRAVTTTPAATPIPLNEITTFGYDQANRLISRSYNDGRGNDSFSYDKAGRPLAGVSGRYENSVVRSYTENSEKGGRLTSERLTLGGTNAGTWKVSYKYDVLDRLTDITYPTGEVVKRTYTTRHQLNTLTLASVNVATRTYDNGGRLLTTTFGNNLIETRTYRSDANGVDNQLATQSIPGVTSFTYTYDANKRIAQETNGLFAAQTQQFLAYDNENRLTNWKRGTTETQAWTLSKVGDWTSTTINGVVQNRTHSPVHEVTAVAGVPLSYDLKGNLTQNQDGSVYGWDSENRLSSALVTEPTRAMSDTARYRYDALGRRVQKLVFGLATTYVHHGAQVVHEFDAKILLPVAVTGEDGDGTGTPPGGGILQGSGVTRINYQPERSQIPSGFFADKGKTFSLRTNGKSYGWKGSPRLDTLARNQHPLPQFDTFNQCWLNNTGTAGTWEIALANGTYAVVVVMGDCASANQTNDLGIEGQAQTDPDPATTTPPGYQYGDFDGYAITATVSDGTLTLSVPATASNPKLCFIEIGPQGSSITQADRDRLTDAIADATAETGYGAFPKPQPTPRQYVYGSYVDEPLLMRAAGNRYYYASNRLYSVAAITTQAGQVAERYKYDAYGKQAILADNGVVAYKPSDYGNFTGFTGRYHDWETGLAYFRARYYDPNLGMFIQRNDYGERDIGYSVLSNDRTNVRLIYFRNTDPQWQYVDGLSLYSATFASMGGVDPSGQPNDIVPIPDSRGDSAFIEVDKAGPGVGNEISVRDNSGKEIGRFKYENGNWSQVKTHAGSEIDYSAYEGDTKRGRALRNFVDNAKLKIERHISEGSCNFGKLKRGLRILGLLGLIGGLAEANEQLSASAKQVQAQATYWNQDPSDFTNEHGLKTSIKQFMHLAVQYSSIGVVAADASIEAAFAAQNND